MAIERLKFRCYRCNQLLGATPNKAGSVVSCPKCNAELLIPVPELPGDPGSEPDARVPAPAPAKSQAKPRPVERPPSEPELTAAPERTTSATAVKNVPRPTRPPAYPDELAAALPPDLIDLRPEDLRVEAEFFESLTRQPPAPVASEPAPWPPAPEFAPSFASESYVSPSPPAAALESINTTAPPVVPAYLTETVDLTLPRPAEAPVKPPAQAPSAPPLIGTAIEIEHPSILPPGSEPRRITEVVLPASAVLSFSLFALLGIALSFVAGLLMGHFIWTAH
jgi:hypothetical protein